MGVGRGRLEVEQAFSTYSPGQTFIESARLQAGHPLVFNMNEGTLTLKQTYVCARVGERWHDTTT